ncbi:MAG: SagB/ThcOx family dehydrogenase [Pseudomonadota bacterium]
MTGRPVQNRRFCQPQPGLDIMRFAGARAQILAYHQRTKHSVHGYALGPASLDWDAQPNPYRRYEKCESLKLPFTTPSHSYGALFGDEIPAAALSRDSLAQLLEYALSLAAIKVFGVDSWTVRCNPSSGNLHPTEAYLISSDVDGLTNGVYHYNSQDHALERRAHWSHPSLAGAYIALTSVHWREAWKYGERAYRYCQLDIGHAIGALRYSAALLGWKLHLETRISDRALARLCGTDRNDDFAGVEPEAPDLLLRIEQSPALTDTSVAAFLANAEWFGLPNLLDPRPLYEWQIIDQVSQACEKPPSSINTPRRSLPCRRSTDVREQGSLLREGPTQHTPAAQLIKQRRSALAFRPDQTMDRASFNAILTALLPERYTLPFDLLPHTPRLHPVLFVHRVAGLTPGLYCLPRRAEMKTTLQAVMHAQFLWEPIDDVLPLYLLQEGDARALAKQICCHQNIASDSAFALGMLAEFGSILSDDETGWRYRELHWEAGLLGQALYLEAEAHGYRGTGIGCYLDDLFHELLGLGDQRFQSLYHFTVGSPVLDSRISTRPPYLSRSPS